VSWTPRIPGLTKQQCWDLDGSNVWPPSLITITEEEHGATNEAPRWDMYDPLDDWRLKSRPISNECGSKDYLFFSTGATIDARPSNDVSTREMFYVERRLQCLDFQERLRATWSQVLNLLPLARLPSQSD
jgi:hypothetical protein